MGSQSDGRQVASFAAAAEDLGYESLWVSDRVLAPREPSDLYPVGGTSQHPYPAQFTAVLDPIVTLTAAAASTTSVRLGMSTLNALWHNPLLLGRSLTSLDLVSGGRLDVGIGLGWLQDEYDAVGVPWTGKAARLDEILDVLRALWNDNPVEHHGPLFDITSSYNDLTPAQRGGPPLLLGGFGAAALERVGRRGDGWLPVWGLPAQYLASLWQIARSAAEDRGRDPDSLRREMRINIAPGQTMSDVATICDEIDAMGIESAFVDLNYVTDTVEAAVLLAADLMVCREGSPAGVGG
nr:TIGR03619 family F420-dependent LLM class oxidoreductase [Williamsia sp. 1135]